MNPAAHYREVQRASANDCIARHSDLVRRIAHHLAARRPASVEIDDLIQAGMMGLIEASRSYDAEQGASFETYASIRIRGSMIDEIRRGDWVPRSVHRRARDAAATIRRLEQASGRAASATAPSTSAQPAICAGVMRSPSTVAASANADTGIRAVISEASAPLTRDEPANHSQKPSTPGTSA